MKDLYQGLFIIAKGNRKWLKHLLDSSVRNGVRPLGWIFDIKRLRAHANEHSDWQIGKWWEWNIKLVIPIILTVIIFWTLHTDITGSGGEQAEAQLPDDGET